MSEQNREIFSFLVAVVPTAFLFCVHFWIWFSTRHKGIDRFSPADETDHIWWHFYDRLMFSRENWEFTSRLSLCMSAWDMRQDYYRDLGAHKRWLFGVEDWRVAEVALNYSIPVELALKDAVRRRLM